MGELWRRLQYLVHRNREQQALREEMEAHREMMGAPHGFGNTLRLREESDDVWVWPWLDQFRQDLRFGIRSLAKSPGFTVTTVLTLTFGIGVNLALFELVNAGILRPPAIREPATFGRLYQVWEYPGGGGGWQSGFSNEIEQRVRENRAVLAGVMSVAQSEVTWGDGGEPVEAEFVSPNYFQQIGYGAAAGRVLDETLDNRAEAGLVVVASHRFWSTRLGADVGRIGGEVRVNGVPATLIGVSDAGMPQLDRDHADVWIPLSQYAAFHPAVPGVPVVALYGRLREGVSPEALTTALDPLIASFTEGDERRRIVPYMATDWFRRPEQRRLVWMIAAPLAGLTLLVLLVSCANLGSLVLVRTTSRVRELGVRAALGAGRWRVARQLVTEHLVLALAGAAGGVLFGNWITELVSARVEEIAAVAPSHDWHTVLAALGLAALATIACAGVPAWRVCSRDLTCSIKDGGAQSSSALSTSRLRPVFVGAQVMGSCVLLVAAGMMLAKLRAISGDRLGLRYENVAMLTARPEFSGLGRDGAGTWWLAVADVVNGHPESDGVAFANVLPFGEDFPTATMNGVPGLRMTQIRVTPEFFDLMGIRIVEGRNFRPDDDTSMVIVSRTTARAIFGDSTAVGKRFANGYLTIVGVADDAKLAEIEATDRVAMFQPLPSDLRGASVLLSRARRDPELLVPVMREAARQAGGNVLAHVTLMRDAYAAEARIPRLMSIAGTVIGAVTLLLACLGIFGLVSYWVRERTKEIGIRVAVGADSGAILWLVLRGLALPVAVGLTAGLAVSLQFGGLVTGEPFYLDGSWGAVHIAAIAVLIATAAVAALAPARSALRIDPVRALRHE